MLRYQEGLLHQGDEGNIQASEGPQSHQEKQKPPSCQSPPGTTLFSQVAGFPAQHLHLAAPLCNLTDVSGKILTLLNYPKGLQRWASGQLFCKVSGKLGRTGENAALLVVLSLYPVSYSLGS